MLMIHESNYNMGKKEKIRVIALAVILQDEHIFVTEYINPTNDEPYYRPLGGGVDFHETGIDAVQRELLEEINAPLSDVSYLGMLENIFETDEGRGHQICLMYNAIFAEPERIHVNYSVVGQEGKKEFNALWKPLAMFRAGDAPLYPNGLLALLDTELKSM
ncbi:MAG: NUDIX domain-containing protein [Chloroflexota bacterium]